MFYMIISDIKNIKKNILSPLDIVKID